MTLCADGPPKSNNVDINRKDMIVIAVPSVGVTLEAGVGKKTMPVLALKSSFFGTIQKNFYSVRVTKFLYFSFNIDTHKKKHNIFKYYCLQMNIESFVTLEMAYYNARLALWEPVIEPISIPHTGSGISSYSPWKLEMNVIYCFISIKLDNANPIYSVVLCLTLQIEMLNNVNEGIEDTTCNLAEDVPDNLSALSIDKDASPPAFSLNIKSNVINSAVFFFVF